MVNAAEAGMVHNNEAASRLEARVDGQTAFLEYKRSGTQIALVHTFVPASLEGRGLGAALARAGLDIARGERLKVAVECPFVQSYLRRHPEYNDLSE